LFPFSFPCHLFSSHPQGVLDASKRAYIATQAPKPETMADFWRYAVDANGVVSVVLLVCAMLC
jgi:protein tyrosine phosphatase